MRTLLLLAGEWVGSVTDGKTMRPSPEDGCEDGLNSAVWTGVSVIIIFLNEQDSSFSTTALAVPEDPHCLPARN